MELLTRYFAFWSLLAAVWAPVSFAARPFLKDGLSDEPTKDEKASLKFLYANQPVSDRRTITYGYLLDNTRLALRARGDNAWAQQVPWDIFLNYVLPYANLDEPRDGWRPLFYNRFAPLVADAGSILEAAMELNTRIWTLGGWNISFKSEQTPAIMAPSQVLAAGYASCTGLSIFLVDACRAVGIPARVAGVPEWLPGGGNHNWVEVWQDGAWSFTGPLEAPADRRYNATWWFPDPVRNALPHKRLNAVYGASYAVTGTTFPLAWQDEYESSVPAHDVTSYYLAAAAELAPVQGTAEGVGAVSKGGRDVGTGSEEVDVQELGHYQYDGYYAQDGPEVMDPVVQVVGAGQEDWEEQAEVVGADGGGSMEEDPVVVLGVVMEEGEGAGGVEGWQDRGQEGAAFEQEESAAAQESHHHDSALVHGGDSVDGEGAAAATI